jgi:hypothetical protein
MRLGDQIIILKSIYIGLIILGIIVILIKLNSM